MEILKTWELDPLQCLSFVLHGLINPDNIVDGEAIFYVQTNIGVCLVFCIPKQENNQTILSPYRLTWANISGTDEFYNNIIFEHIKNYIKLTEVIK